ncbi:MAG: response regulator [Pleurocapsa sp. MO_192.B19]|nr:response regulator [Pleurocapsa sp. MO_192.B19]
MNKNLSKVPQDILIVDDTLANLKVLSETLTNEGYEVRAVKSGQTALTAVQTMPPRLILLDIHMPEMNGYEVCQRLKANEATCNIPIIFLTASNEASDKVKAFESGGADYIAKPFQIEEVLARVKNQLGIQAAQAEIRQLNAALEEKVKERTKHLNQKINELEQTKKVLHDTFYDRLTDLPNRILFSKHLDQAVIRTKKNPHYGFALLFLECAWQGINQSGSQLVEHKLIVAIVKKILSSIREVDTLARIGNDKFIVLLPEIQNIYRTTYIAQQIHQQFTSPLSISQQQIEVSISIGIVLGTEEYQQPAHILRDAKFAAHQAQKLGRNHYCLFNSTQQSVSPG